MKRNSDDFVSMQHKRIKINYLNDLYNEGYQVLKKSVDIQPKIKDYLIKLADNNSSAIFNHNEMSKTNDRKRRQVNIRPKSKYMIKFMDGINTKLSSLFPHLEPNDWVIIQSKPNCKSQAAHVDYPPPQEKIDDQKQIPINVLVAIQDNTFLNIWPKSHQLICQEYINKNKICNDDDDDENESIMDTKEINMKKIRIDAGDILLFRGDVVHGGAEYKEANYRMHCFLDSGYRKPNRTWLVHESGSDFLKQMIKIE